MNARLIIPCICALVVFNSIAQADASGTGKVTIVGGQFAVGSYPASIHFGITPAPINRAACNTDTRYQFVFDPNTADGKALYAALLWAQATDMSISVKGTGSCVLGQAMEGILYWRQDP